MSSSPTVVVKKGGVLTALVSGIFGTVIVSVLCGAGLGFYGLNMLDRKVSEVLGGGKFVLEAVPALRESLAVVSDLLDDRRAPEYRDHLDTSVRTARPAGRREGPLAVVEVANRGDQTITYMTARVVAADSGGVPLREYRTFVATPVGFDEDEWRGPLLPGETRRFSLALRDCPWDSDIEASIEITDLRIWNKDRALATAPVEEDVGASP